MIPKIIHYCWFGRGPKPVEAQNFINGWSRLHPDFRIVEWNEDNFDINCCPYVQQAYERKKFAFVSDYARGVALLNEGGVYLDTDVELIGRLDLFLRHEAFFGFEEGNLIATSIIGCSPSHPIIKSYLDQYHDRSFIKPDGTVDMTTNVTVMTRLLTGYGLQLDGKAQELGTGIFCYPKQYFSPLDYIRFIDHRDASTIAIHHYHHTWGGSVARLKKRLRRLLSAIFESAAIECFRRLCAKVF